MIFSKLKLCFKFPFYLIRSHIWITYSISFTSIIMSSHDTLLLNHLYNITGKVYIISVTISSVLLQYYQPTYTYTLYIWGDFTWGQRSYINHPDYYVGKSVLNGKIQRTKNLHKIFPYKVINVNTAWEYYYGRSHVKSPAI